MSLNRRLPSVRTSHFAMVPRGDVPRSKQTTQHTYKTTMDAGKLVPFYLEEMLPGDTFQGEVTVFARLQTLLFPLMDNLELESFFFFTPNRILWTNWEKFMGAQDNPADSIAFTIPTVPAPPGGFAVGSVYDYFGLPCQGQLLAGNTINVNALPLRAYNRIFNDWFKDEDLDNNLLEHLGDAPDPNTSYTLQTRRKKHDYFTSCRPWAQKGGVAVPFPLGTSAPVIPSSTHAVPTWWNTAPGSAAGALTRAAAGAGTAVNIQNPGNAGSTLGWDTTGLIADLNAATGTSVNALRTAMATQQLLEKDARGGTRYTEFLRNHFGVNPEDSRLQRPEYVGGGRTLIETQAMPQTSVTGATPLGALAGAAAVTDRHKFSYSATEHGYIMGIVNVRADITYQQGVSRLWSRSTRYDFYLPVFANLGEQAVLNKELYVDGSANDTAVFGYQERWAEYRYFPSMLTGLFRSRSAGTIDPWHLSQNFTSLPALNTSFISENIPLSRALAAGTGANGMQVLFDSFFRISRTRPIPVFSVPGLKRF
uniref:Putative capsid VP1 n=1 Tax=uncultured virus TaxID=340016 RepID=A0A1D8MKA8_9VIRU|nr:putative capsid VP1 [uncultured virus]